MDEQRLSEICDKLFGDDESGLSNAQKSHLSVKTMELYRQTTKSCSDYLPITRQYACLHLAARSLGIGCRLDMMAKQLSGFNTASVQEASRAIVALLELKLDDAVDMKTICIQFGCMHLLMEAERFLHFADNELKLTQRNSAIRPALVVATFVCMCTAMRVKRIDQKHLCELAECLPRDFKKIKMAIDRNDSCRQFLFNLKDPSTNMQANNPRKRKEPVITAESSSKAEEDSSIRSTKPPQADSCAPSNGIHSMIGFEGWNKNQKFTNYIQWKHDLLQSLPPISADSRRAAELMRRQVQFSANPYVSLMSL